MKTERTVRLVTITVALILAMVLPGTPSSAASTQVGLLDPTFGGDGRVTTDLSTTIPTEDAVYGVAVQPDGKIVAVGYRNSPANQWMAVVRYDTDGTLDSSFGDDGVVLTHFRSGAEGDAVVLQPDGKIVVVGTTWIRSALDWGFAVARFNTDGTLDETFGGTGRVRTVVGDDLSEATGVALDAHGDIVVVGQAASSGAVFAVVRYTPDGSLDGRFGVDGIVLTPIGHHGGSSDDVAIQPDGAIVVAGAAGTRNGSDIALARYQDDGTLDPSFGNGGIVRTSFGDGQEGSAGVELQPDGKIVIGGGAGYSAGFAFVRYMPDGTLDPTFAGDGFRTVTIGWDANVGDIALQPDGSIVAVGVSGPSDNTSFAVARLDTNGELDQTFRGDGKLVTSVGHGFAWATSVAVQPDGGIVAAGWSPTTDTNFNSSDFALARYAVPTSRPDAQIRAPWGATFGNDIYNDTAQHQSLGDWGHHHRTFIVRIENDASASDTYAVTGDGSTSAFRVRYVLDGTVVTKQVTSGTLSIGPLAPGAVVKFKLQIFVRAGTPSGDTLHRGVRISSTVDPTRVDKVRAVMHSV